MTTYLPNSWEYQLLAWAEQAQQSRRDTVTGESAPGLSSAYAYCAAVTRQHSRTFYLASSMLPADKRRAARALYAFCRVTDNIVDHPQGDPAANLEVWRARLNASNAYPNPVIVAWTDAKTRFGIPSGYSDQLIDGVKRDLTQKRYQTFSDVAEYSYGVASTVGLMAMHITGFSGDEAIPYAVRLGVALQITNILRDVAEDWKAGRVYLPQDELADFGLSDADIGAGRVTDRWRRFMRFQIQRNRALYNDSWRGIALLDPDGRLAITAAGKLYDAILSDIERHDYDVFSRRAHVRLTGKLSRLPTIWWMSRRAQQH
ncbi:MAG: squalene/phytoene synthase family protein [Chloroflexi bacterium]|nr:squalene/phytoene synthase family protein [Chloroflexota bacterium]